MARANKLTKMGFGVSGTGSPAGGVGGNETWSGGRNAQGHKHRFGGIRTLVHTLTGKS